MMKIEQGGITEDDLHERMAEFFNIAYGSGIPAEQIAEAATILSADVMQKDGKTEEQYRTVMDEAVDKVKHGEVAFNGDRDVEWTPEGPVYLDNIPILDP